MTILIAMAAVCALVEGLLIGMPDVSQDLDDWAITVEDAMALEPVLWVDGRSTDAYLSGHLEGAVHLNLDGWETGLGNLLQEWDPGLAVVVYCDGNGCESSRSIAERLRMELGGNNVYWLVDGWPALQGEGMAP